MTQPINNVQDLSVLEGLMSSALAELHRLRAQNESVKAQEQQTAVSRAVQEVLARRRRNRHTPPKQKVTK